MLGMRVKLLDRFKHAQTVLVLGLGKSPTTQLVALRVSIPLLFRGCRDSCFFLVFNLNEAPVISRNGDISLGHSARRTLKHTNQK